MLRRKRSRNKLVEGIVTPISWNEKGDVRLFSLFTSEGEDILIDSEEFFDTLHMLIGKSISIYGTLYRTNYGAQIIYPKRIKVDGHKKEDDIKKSQEITEYDLSIKREDYMRLLGVV